MSLDIVPADKEKWYLNVAVDWFIKKYSDGKNSEVIAEEINDCGNPIIRRIVKLRDKAINSISENHQKRMMKTFGDFGLWMMYKDTAYRQIFIWMLKELFDQKDELMPFINKYYVEPDDWYINKWTKGKQKSKKQIESGEIPEGLMSNLEKYFVPSIQRKRITEELEKMRRRKGW